MTPAFILQHRNVWLREDHDLVGRVIAAKHARRTDRNRDEGSFWIGKGVGHG